MSTKFYSYTQIKQQLLWRVKAFPKEHMERLWTFTVTATKIGHQKDCIIQKVAENAVFIVIARFDFHLNSEK